MTTSCVLITGFGPFPGVPDNVSGRLAEKLARSGASSYRDCQVYAELLPTEWQTVAERGPRLLERLTPRLVVHFGVSMRARGFRIERSAHNIAAWREDACGALPSRSPILDQGKPRIDTALPAARLAAHLRDQGIRATASRSAGTYLCNYLYYLSLDWAERRQAPCDVCFVHIPSPAHLQESELLRGAELILAYLLAQVDERRSAIAAQHRYEAAAGRAEPC